MSISLLPPDFDQQVRKAIGTFWSTRGRNVATRTQGGTRDSVVSGKNMEGFIDLVERVNAYRGFSTCWWHSAT
mgnify:CR=1 FL=1|nr:hypothetical protein [Nitrosomonas nitrosa]